ncbi:MAG TPA: spore coat protein CotJB [Bacilli bacterium]|nr:spore coat protein CotJB [Bacilli bacterium]
MNNQTNNIDPYAGFMKGNLFNNLYDPYKNYMYATIKPTNEKDYMMLTMQTYSFALTDLNLYLDVNPTDTNMIQLYNDYLSKYKQALNQYETKYGPITLTSDKLNQNVWVWDSTTWPWEVNYV